MTLPGLWDARLLGEQEEEIYHLKKSPELDECMPAQRLSTMLGHHLEQCARRLSMIERGGKS